MASYEKNNPQLPAITGDVVDLLVQVVANARTMSFSIPHMASSFGGGAIASNVIAFLANWWTGVSAKVLAIFPATATVAGLFGVVVNRNDVRTAEQVIGSAGTVMTTSLPLQMGAVFQRGTATKGQHGRGRVTFPCVPTTFVTPGTDPNVINATGLAAYLALTNAIFGTSGTPPTWAGGTQVFAPCIFTRPVPPFTTVSLAGPVLPQYCLQDTVLGTQRRRKEGLS
jgi:hypothetical protein